MFLPVTATEEIAVPSYGDATGLPVELGFVPVSARREPADEEYHPAAWAVDDGQDVIVLMVGPAAVVTLPAGEYVVWARVTGASPRRPVRRAGPLTVGGV